MERVSHDEFVKTQKPGKKLLWALGAFALVGVSVWGILSSANASVARSDCLRFAEEMRGQGKLFNKADAIQVGDSWSNHGATVVEVRAFEPGSSMFHSRICVRKSDTIGIVSILQESYWRY
jgi:hypothetical protein